jgi:E3 ubiquitin-protein ligase UHRF1
MRKATTWTCGRERLAKFKPAKLFIRTATPATNDTACICPAQMAGRYERQRLANIAKNQAKLAELGLLDTTLLPRKPSPVAKKRKRTRQPAAPQRRSARAQQRPPPSLYSATHVEDEQTAERALHQQQVDSGHRSATDGRWRGERFGAVPGVAVGAVFGKGDFQRKGRFEMSESGFHVGHVQPEWLDSAGEGCFSLICNNDNGTSRDDGETFTYAGAGGRRRGQNRTAQQSFDQSWDSAVNAVLRKQCANGKPVRVIRGPKLASKYSTADSGGGHRYDGLYTITKAEMVRTGPKRLQTCMFTLDRIAGQPTLGHSQEQ